MWSALALATVIALQPHERASAKPASLPQSGCSSPIAQRIVERFPGAKVLTKQDFTSAVVGRSLRYRDISDGMVVVRPGEFFSEAGTYSFGHRVIMGGTYDFDCGLVSIDTSDKSFLGLGKERVFFRYEGMLLTTGRDERASVFELIPSP